MPWAWLACNNTPSWRSHSDHRNTHNAALTDMPKNLIKRCSRLKAQGSRVHMGRCTRLPSQSHFCSCLVPMSMHLTHTRPPSTSSSAGTQAAVRLTELWQEHLYLKAGSWQASSLHDQPLPEQAWELRWLDRRHWRPLWYCHGHAVHHCASQYLQHIITIMSDTILYPPDLGLTKNSSALRFVGHPLLAKTTVEACWMPCLLVKANVWCQKRGCWVSIAFRMGNVWFWLSGT